MFGFEKFSTSKAAPQEVGPKNTGPEVVAALEDKVRSAVADVPGMEGILTDQDIHMTANYLAIMQEQQGVPYTTESLEASGAELEESIKASLENRLAAKGPAVSGYRVVNKDGFVVGEASSRHEAGEIAGSERAEENRP